MILKKVINDVERLYKRGDYTYVLREYVDRNFWVEKIKRQLPNTYLENQTDFNYATCFTIFINVSEFKSMPWDRDFNDHLKESDSMCIIVLNISAIASYATFTYNYYTMQKGEQKVISKYKPISKQDMMIGNKLKKLLKEEGITLLNDKRLLSAIIPGVSLELKTEKVSVYHCLFEDGDFEVDGQPVPGT